MKNCFSGIVRLLVAIGISLLPVAAYAQPKADSTEISFWESARDSGDNELIEAYLDAYPNGAFHDLASIILKKARSASSAALASAIEQCDVLASNRSDPGRAAAGVNFEDLKKRAKEAIAACEAALDSGEQRHSYQLFRAYHADGRTLEGMKYLLDASENGYIFARNWHANFSLRGEHGLPQDGQLAIKLHKMNVKDGWGSAHFALGRIYRNEDKLPDVQRDYKAAFDHFALGRDSGEAANLFFLGWAYEFGQGVDRSSVAAKRLYRQSLEQTDDRRNQIRKRLADLIRIDLDGKLEAAAPDGISQLDETIGEYKNLLSARRSDVASHTDYVSATGWILWQATKEFVSYRSSEDYSWVTYEKSVGDSVDRQIKAALQDFEVALTERAKAHPSVFPEHSAEGVSAIVAEYLKRLGRVGKEFDQYFIESAALEGAEAGACTTSKSSWDGDYFEIVFSNRCTLPVIVIADLKVTYGSRSGVTRDTDRLVIEAGKRKTARVRADSVTGKIKGSGASRTCFETEGDPVKTETGYQCPRVANWSKRPGFAANTMWIRDTITAVAMTDRK